MGLIESCTELADVLASRLVLLENLEQTRREKLLINLVIFASLRQNHQSNQEKLAMWNWIKSLLNQSSQSIQSSWETAILMTGVC